MNNFSGMGHYIELIPAAQVLNDTQVFAGGTTANASTTNGTTQPLQTQLITIPWSHLESSLCLIQKSFL
ncbi:MAG TPA: hypothetical protein VFS97_14790, partial [Nitrososphaeraceae archaeon]|nr:hypothetical protein [Nitrososphaeraceae archaeon]